MPTVTVGDAEFFYQEDDFTDPWKPTETVFLQHGLCRNSDFLRAWVPAFARHYRVVRMDARGCGNSSDPGRDYEYSVDGWVADFLGFLDATGIDKVHYLGESIGGIIGAASAARAPERFHSLTLVSTPLKIKPETDQLLSYGYANQAEAFEQMGLAAWWKRSQEHSTADNPDPERDEYFANLFARTPPHIAGAIARWVVKADLTEILPQITVPTLVMSPGESYITSAENQDDFVSRIPTAQQKFYPGLRHGMYYLQPDLLSKDACEFMQGISKANAER